MLCARVGMVLANGVQSPHHQPILLDTRFGRYGRLTPMAPRTRSQCYPREVLRLRGALRKVLERYRTGAIAGEITQDCLKSLQRHNGLGSFIPDDYHLWGLRYRVVKAEAISARQDLGYQLIHTGAPDP